MSTAKKQFLRSLAISVLRGIIIGLIVYFIIKFFG